jgi:hypothetical protein
MEDNKPTQLVTDKQVRRRTILSFIGFFIFIGVGYLGYRWLYHTPDADGVHAPLRMGYEVNEQIFGGAHNRTALVKTYSVSAAVKKVRVNGDAGMGNNFDPKTWKMHLVRKPGDTLLISIDEIKALPKTEIIFDFKCIEGWSQVTHWGGVKFTDFLAHFGLNGLAAYKYIGVQTPDKEYYVGIDMNSMLQPQTILCYEMNGKPLPYDQGAPLRLIIPVKYGIKHLKRIGYMFFENNKPADYWAERGYDYYSGH